MDKKAKSTGRRPRPLSCFDGRKSILIRLITHRHAQVSLNWQISTFRRHPKKMAPIHRMGAPLINQIKAPRFVTLFIACKHKRKFEKLCAVYTWLLTNLSHPGAHKEKIPVWLFFLFFNRGSASPDQASPWENPATLPRCPEPGNFHGPGLRCIV